VVLGRAWDGGRSLRIRVRSAAAPVTTSTRGNRRARCAAITGFSSTHRCRVPVGASCPISWVNAPVPEPSSTTTGRHPCPAGRGNGGTMATARAGELGTIDAVRSGARTNSRKNTHPPLPTLLGTGSSSRPPVRERSDPPRPGGKQGAHVSARTGRGPSSRPARGGCDHPTPRPGWPSDTAERPRVTVDLQSGAQGPGAATSQSQSQPRWRGGETRSFVEAAMAIDRMVCGRARTAVGSVRCGAAGWPRVGIGRGRRRAGRRG
jgi:hypothetical protein